MDFSRRGLLNGLFGSLVVEPAKKIFVDPHVDTVEICNYRGRDVDSIGLFYCPLIGIQKMVGPTGTIFELRFRHPNP